VKTSIQLTAEAGPWNELVDFVTESERLGVDMVWVAEAWGAEAATPLGYLAAVTNRMAIGAAIFQVGTRSPVLIAQTAMTLAHMSSDRFVLGLGASGPQVIEGLHGVEFSRPLTRMRETIDVIEQAFSGERIAYDGQTIRLPRPRGQGKALRLGIQTETPIPIYLAALSPKMLELTGERCDGWIGTSFVPEGADDAYFSHLRVGARKTGRTLSDIDICQGAEVAFARDEQELGEMIDQRRAGLAFSLGGMGSADTNFYNSAYARQGFADVAEEAQRLWLEGDRHGAAAVIPDEMVLATTLIGTEEMVRDRLQVWADSGVTTIRLYPAGANLYERLATLGRALDLVAAT